jgi:hypothetical protein
MCWASNHQNIYRNVPRAHFPFNLPLFGDLCQHIKSKSKCNNIFNNKLKSANWRSIHLTYDLAYLDHFCHHLVYFHKTNSFSYLYVRNICFGKSKDLSRINLIKCQKLPLFPIIKFLPHKRTILAIRGFWSNTKNLTLKFWNSQVVGWSSCFGLNFSPFGIKHQNMRTSWPFNPIASSKCQIRSKGNENTLKNLGQDTLIPECSGSPFFIQVHIFPFNSTLRL